MKKCEDKKYMPLKDALAQIASIAVHDETLRRWHRQGLRGVKIETVLVGGQLLTTVDAMRKFIEQTNKKSEATNDAT